MKYLLCLALAFCVGTVFATSAASDRNMIVSLSTDGSYALSSNTSQQAILWDIKNKTYKIIANNVNIYSAYFIKNTRDFIYQDNISNDVIVENTDLQIIKKFNPGFPTYGQIMTSDLSTWVGSDETFQLFKITADGWKQQMFYSWDGPNFVHEIPPPKGMPYGSMNFLASGKLFNLVLSADNKTLVSSGENGYYLWDVVSGELILKGDNNVNRTTVAFSPDGRYILSMDEGSGIYRYDIARKRGVRSVLWAFDDNGAAEVKIYDAVDGNELGSGPGFAQKYIDNEMALVFLRGVPDSFSYAVLVDPVDAQCFKKAILSSYYCKIHPKKYLPLVPNAETDFKYRPEDPALYEFARDMAIDTSPSQHILVMAMSGANGILVYQYDPVTQTLHQVWAPQIKKPWWHLFS